MLVENLNATGCNPEVAAFRAATRAVLENHAFAEAARGVLTECKTLIGVDTGFVAMCAPKSEGFELFVIDPGHLDSGSLELEIAAGSSAQLRQLGSRAVALGRSVFANDLSKNATVGLVPDRPPLQNVLCAPILISGEVTAILALIDKPGGFAAADQELVEVFAELIAVAMLRSRTVSGFKEALSEATSVLSRSLDPELVVTTLLERLRWLVSFDHATIMVVEDSSRVSIRTVFDGDRITHIAPEERTQLDTSDYPIVQDILTNGTTVLISDLRTQPEGILPANGSEEASWMGIPLFARSHVVGLFFLSKREPDYFNEGHVELIEAMSSQASVVIENAILFEQMKASTARMQLLSRRLVEIQESERRHIARELHDEAGQTLISLRYGLRLLEREISKGHNVSTRVAALMMETDAAIDGLRRLAADLRPASLDHLGLEAALRQLLRSTSANVGLKVQFKARGFTSERLPPTVETALYRVVQEAVTNVARHAQATRVDVFMEHRDDRVMVMIEDDGTGFEPDRVLEDHFGLLSMRERAEALDGSLTVESAPGAGTTIVVEVASADPHSDR